MKEEPRLDPNFDKDAAQWQERHRLRHEIKKLIKELRGSVSLNKAARGSGIVPGTLKGYADASRLPKIDTLAILAAAFNKKLVLSIEDRDILDDL